MKSTNFNRNEKAVLAEFEHHYPGAWISRAWLENDLIAQLGIMDQRTLDRTLTRLVESGYLVRMPTQDRGSLYALPETEKEFPGLKDFARELNTRNRRTCAQAMPPIACHHCGAMSYIPVAMESGFPIKWEGERVPSRKRKSP